MKRLSAALAALALSVLLLVAATAASAALRLTAARAASGAPARAQLRGFACHPALDPPNRLVSVTAVMRPLSGTMRLSLKFDLLVSRGASTPHRVVRAGDLGAWITPQNPTLGHLPGDVWNLHKTVVELAAPATYRFRVWFRWTGAHGRVLGLAVRYSRTCHQRELRPDLFVRSVAVTAIQNRPSYDRYTAVIANAGDTAAGPFDLLFAPANGSSPQTHVVSLLGAHSTRTESFVGPVCSAATAPTITVDSASQIDDSNRANNTLGATCPASVAAKRTAGASLHWMQR